MSHTDYTKEELESMSTVMLMSLLNSARAQVSIGTRNLEPDCEVSKVISEVCVHPYQIFVNQLKDILSTREHILNKEERRIIRQQKQKEKQSR